MRTVGSAESDPYSSMAAAIGALYGPLHGGANEAVLRMLKEIGHKNNVAKFVNEVKTSGGDVRLMGFGHRVYKNFDPRAKIIKKMADQVFEVTGHNPLLEIAIELERIALEDEYFIKRKLYPNVDFYSGIIYRALGFSPDMFTVLFALGRLPGWMSHWNEHNAGKAKIGRPRQIYTGKNARDFVASDKR
jgi:citrate synthase